MKDIVNAKKVKGVTPNNESMNYLVSDEGIVYASAKSWAKALKVPKEMVDWFQSGLGRTSTLRAKKDRSLAEKTFEGICVYRWPIVAEQLRVFDRKWHNGAYDSSSRFTKKDIDDFYDSYDNLLSWGYRLQEEKLAINLVPSIANDTQALENIIDSYTKPLLTKHDVKLTEHDIVITDMNDKLTDIEKHLPEGLKANEFITIRQAVLEKKLDGEYMPYYPNLKQNLTSLAGELLTKMNVIKGPESSSRTDGNSFVMVQNTYHRVEIYSVLDELMRKKQGELNLSID
ncbi:hypothetical protein [Thiomicrorhabdus sp.]|uniref:hypothetical protein n=1 Tax=Thiomicrorhabdus sp. TaxID=2039724 RepID=UPI002AA656E5|nr:hypothetical protein [Thiomicrorhabdus sp.]